MKKNAIICDLDGTLINCEHRRHFVENGNKDWKSFLHPENIAKDTINIWCKELIFGMHHSNYKILYVTGRNENTRECTENTLFNNDLILCADLMFMRKDGDYRQDSIVKQEIYYEQIEPYYNVIFCVDDRRCVTKMWRSLGLICLQCHEGNF